MMNIENSLGFKLSKASQRMFELFSDSLDEAGITSKQYGTMLIIDENPNMTQKEIAKIQRVDRTTMGQIIDQLEVKHLVIRVKHPTDKRAYWLELSESGQKLLTALWTGMKNCESVFLQKLDDDERKQFFILLDKIERE